MSLLEEGEEAAAAVGHGVATNITKVATGGLSAVSLPVRLVIYGICVAAVAMAVGHIYNMGYDASTDHWKAEMAKADEKFKKDQQKLQDKYDARASTETAANMELAGKLSEAARRLQQPKGTIQGAPTTKLPADCKFDPARIAWANAE